MYISQLCLISMIPIFYLAVTASYQILTSLKFVIFVVVWTLL